jgi:hypothetical protein
MSQPGIILGMTHLRSTHTSRTLTVVLTESDWQALRAIEPDAVGWLHECIRERLGSSASQESQPVTAASSGPAGAWNEDEY